ncbi:MAG: nicotinate phosphoribosyltransferase [Candidatus Tectimicrobiota bacterium]
MPFHTADSKAIKAGKVTDVYFARTVEILQAKGLHKRCVAEVTFKNRRADQAFGVLAGVEELAELLTDVPVDVKILPEGSFFQPFEPVAVLEGIYTDFAIYETALLGLLCQASGIATEAAHCKLAAGDKLVISFGARRMHPAIAPMVERNAFIGGCDGVAVVASAELIHEEPVGTIPHALVLMFGGVTEATCAFDEVVDPTVRRVALVDTLFDEKIESLRVAEALGETLWAVRFDTPGSRRGNMRQILEEVRWELDLRGYEHVKFFLSGGISAQDIAAYADLVDGFGVGTSISSAKVIDFALDIVEIEGEPIAKRGKWAGRKEVIRCTGCGTRAVVPASRLPAQCQCGGPIEPQLVNLIEGGRPVAAAEPPQVIRKRVVDQLADLRKGEEARAGR